MTRLEWDRIEDRQYQLGIDRGVLYPVDGGPGVAWNGLVSVAESTGREAKSWYQEGVKIFEYAVPKPFSARIQAFTYPDILEDLLGSQAPSGIRVHDQPARKFHLCYRTLVGSELDGVDHAYKLHLLYNLTAVVDDTTYASLGGQASPIAFGWSVSSVPMRVEGMRPASHISLDSREVDAGWLATLEEGLYGDPDSDPRMLMPDDFF